jgi:polysaccharide deacetylase 2 family uncharacterized protein YibQ
MRTRAMRPATVAVYVSVVGLLVGVGLSQGWWLGGRTPVDFRGTRTGIAVGDDAVDTAVRDILDQDTTVMTVTTRPRTAQQRGEVYQWTTRTIEIKARGRVSDLVRRLNQRVAPVGGRVLSQTPTAIQVGIRRGGVEAVTHEIRLIPFVPAARVAILFDDAGGSLVHMQAIIDLGRPVTITVLPGLRFSREVAVLAEEAGLDVMLHLPLEPEDPKLPLGPGGITTAMTDAQIAQVVAADLDQVPGAIGINNHEGSKATADERVMRAVLEVVRSRGLFFVDSVTSPRTIAGRMAAQMQIPTASRSVFLDNQNQAEAIRTQLRELITVALQRKQAIAIGHAMRMTPQVLQEMLVEFDRQDIELVPVSTFVH